MNDGRWLLLLCLSRMGFAVINTVYAALIPVLRPAWGMSAAQAGSVQSAWHGGYIVSLVVASLLAGRFGAKRTFLGMGYAACATALLFALGAHDFESAFLLYGLAGLCAGGSYVPGLTLIAERFRSASRGRAMGAYIAAASLGYALGLPGAAGLALHIAGWGITAGFLLAAVAALLGLAVATWTLRTSANVQIPAADRGPVASWASLCWLWRNRPARFVILGYTFHAWELLGMWAWLPAFLSVAASQQGDASWLGSGALAGAALAALTHLVSMVGSLAGGVWSDRWGRSRVILALSLLSIACSLLFGWLLPAPLWILVVLAALFNFSAVGDSAIYSAALTERVPQQHLATAYALRSILGFGMGALSPWLFGLLLDLPGNAPVVSWGLAWTGLGLVALVGPYLSWRLLRV
ncbi:MAG TPA: MFS transporter [Azonexus sp.]|nr:MFS transporter [Azonexus sp.]